MKRLVVCCDGTWQKLSSPYPTNVVKIAVATKLETAGKIQQIVYYDEGVGTEFHNKFGGGMFGAGLNENIIQAYCFLCLNYEENDEIYLFGFSRGAYTVRSLAGLIYKCGLLKREKLRLVPDAFKLYRDRSKKNHPEEPVPTNFRLNNSNEVAITALCCWDTVGSLGIPNKIPILSKILNRKYTFHDMKLSKVIKNAFHAVALDERRRVFDWTPMHASRHSTSQKVKQLWFVGDHGCIGGGDESKKPFSDVTLRWMINELKPVGLELDETKIADKIQGNPFGDFDNNVGLFFFTGSINRRTAGGFDVLHDSVKSRLKLNKRYRPGFQEEYKDQINAWEKVTYP